MIKIKKSISILLKIYIPYFLFATMNLFVIVSKVNILKNGAIYWALDSSL